MATESLLVHTLVELADTLVDDFDVVELLTLLTDRCVELLPITAAGLMLVSPDGDLRVVGGRAPTRGAVMTGSAPSSACPTVGRPDALATP